MDTVRGDAESGAGYVRPTTPALDAFAKRGVVFTQALSRSPWTLPTHGTTFTGTLPHEQSGKRAQPRRVRHRGIRREHFIRRRRVWTVARGGGPDKRCGSAVCPRAVTPLVSILRHIDSRMPSCQGIYLPMPSISSSVKP